jgi:hypothetical protein
MGYTAFAKVYQRLVVTQPSAQPTSEFTGRDVVGLRWPEQADQRDRLDRADIPRLWFVEPGVEPPICETWLEDWVRLPADDSDVRARLVGLARRAASHPLVPALDSHGQITFRGAVASMSPVEQVLAEQLVARFGHPVPEPDLLRAVWLDGGRDETLRVHLSRLRHRLAPIGLEITNIRGYGYLLRPQTEPAITEGHSQFHG